MSTVACKKCGGVTRYPSGGCVQCVTTQSAAYYKKHKAALDQRRAHRMKISPVLYKEQRLRWIAANPEKAKILAIRNTANWRARNPNQVKAVTAAYRANNAALVKQCTLAWRKANPEKLTLYYMARRAAKHKAIPKWFGELDSFIIQEAAALRNNRNHLFGFKWEIDHAVPLISDLVCGLHIGCNIQVVPATYNRAKGNRYWVDKP